MRVSFWIYLGAVLVTVVVGLFFYMHRSKTPAERGYYADGPHGRETKVAVRIRRDAANVTVDTRLVRGNNTLAFRLLQTEVARHPKGNVLLAPPVLLQSLSLAMNGAGPATRTRLEAAAGVHGMSGDDLNIANATLLQLLQRADQNAGLTLGYGVWAPAGHAFNSAFTSQAEDLYSAEIGVLDPAKVNAWAQLQSVGRVETLLPAAADGVVLGSLATLNAAWEDAFDAKETVQAPFYLADGSRVTVPMLTHTGSYPYCENSQFQAIALPYSSGRLALYVILPAANVPLAAFEGAMKVDNWESWMNSFASRKVTLALPRMSLSTNEDYAAALGVAGAADFHDMLAGASPTLAQVRHAAQLETWEAGTATGAAIDRSAVPEKVALPDSGPAVSMTLTRPFFLAVREKTSGALFFIGSVQDPR